MANLENLRKQAKLYLRWHHDRRHTVAEQIRTTLPRFRNLSDREILDSPFKLADAQELVARQTGFETWQALKTGVISMSKDTQQQTVPSFGAAEPCVFTTDMEGALAFYTEKLGFEVVFTYGEPAFYGQVRRDKALVNLRHVDGSPFHDEVRERDELLLVSFNVGNAADIRTLFQQFQSAGVEFHRPLKQEPWGARTFIVRDPDGNLLLFAGTAA
jgi:catechol 2,3-dioxygenase-like lactoylglutathione lyase family enzyme